MKETIEEKMDKAVGALVGVQVMSARFDVARYWGFVGYWPHGTRWWRCGVRVHDDEVTSEEELLKLAAERLRAARREDGKFSVSQWGLFDDA